VLLTSLIIPGIDSPSRTSHPTVFPRNVLKEKIISALPAAYWAWTLWTDSAMQKHLNYHKHEPRDLEDLLFHTVLLITYSSYVISCYLRQRRM